MPPGTRRNAIFHERLRTSLLHRDFVRNYPIVFNPALTIGNPGQAPGTVNAVTLPGPGNAQN
jgi:hypothetical protein